jgi:hypothetical protein
MVRLSSAPRFGFALIALSLSGSCAHRPPAYMVSDRIWAPHHSGYVFRTGYYTPAELRDSRWERRRRDMRDSANYCDPRRARVVRRDVVWYPATPVSQRRCAAIVYTMECGHENRLVSSTPDEVRHRVLAQDLQRPIGRDCGNKDGHASPG